MRRANDLGRLGAPFPDAGLITPTAQVKAAIAAASGKRRTPDTGFHFDRVSGREALVAPLFGVYLGIAVARIHERFPDLAVPGMELALMAIMLLTLFLSVPLSAWPQVWRASKPLRMVAVITACAIITIPLGIWYGNSADYLINHFTIALGVFITALLLSRDRKILRRVLVVYVFIVTVIAVANLIAYLRNDASLTMLGRNAQALYVATGVANLEKLRQAYGSLDPNDIAAVMATTFPMALWLGVGGFGRRVLWSTSAMVLALAVIPTASRGGLLGVIGAAIVLALLGARGGKRIFIGGMLAVGTILFMVVAGPGLDRMQDVGGAGYNLTQGEGRIAIWKRGIVWTIKRPWGYGMDNFPIYFGRLNGPERAAHNSLIQCAVELGVIGISAYLIIWGTVGIGLWRARRNAMLASPPDNDTVALTGHVLAMGAGSWITGFFLSNAYYPITYMVMGIGAGVLMGFHGATRNTVAAPVPTVGRRTGGAPTRRRRQFKAFDAPR